MIPSANWHTGALISRGEPRDEGRERERERRNIRRTK